MELIALCAPWILLLSLVAVVFLILWRKWKVSIVVALMALAGNWYFRCFPVDVFDNSDGKVLRVLSFNCNLSPRHDKDYCKSVQGVAHLIDSIDADVVFLTENFGLANDSVWRIIQHRFPYRLNWERLKNSTGNTIYSKYPIIADTTFKSKDYPYTTTNITIRYKSQHVNIFGVHLSSNNYNEHMEYMTPDSVESRQQAKMYLRNILEAGKHRQKEAEQIVAMVDSQVKIHGEIPTIVMGDFNDVCGSPTINVLESSGLKDAWWHGGFGYGATMRRPLPYRIDHIMYNDKLQLKNIKKIDAYGLSDHDALMAEFNIVR